MTTSDLSALPSTPATPAAAATARPGPGGLSLRLRIHLIVAGLMALFVATLLWLQIDATRRSVHEEIVGANRVAAQLLQRVTWVYTRSGPQALIEFLAQLGRVRANDISLLDEHGQLLYRSPPSTYKEGRNAPDWYSRLVVPPLQRQVIALPGGQLAVEADPSRAILDGWDDFRVLVGVAGAALLLLLGGVFWLVGRTLRPFPTIVAALERIERGDLRTRLPELRGHEAATIGAAINRMSAAVEGHLIERLRAFEVERSLSESRELARQIEHHMERERREIARELHDELGQSVTAIRSLAASLVLRLGERDPQGRELAGLIGSEALRLDDAMHSLIPRLAPLALDQLNLADCLSDLVASARQREPAIEIVFNIDAPLPELDGDTALAAYRVVQEALNNALRHSGAHRIAIMLSANERLLDISVSDDGQGLSLDGSEPLQHKGRYGLRGLRERVRALGGRFELASPSALDTGRGLRVQAWLPLQLNASATVAPPGVPR
ncbi:MAG: ATP-binding protein [Leptothrix sp. (in: b-proteobacteria)]